jgi:hypothetical protein
MLAIRHVSPILLLRISLIVALRHLHRGFILILLFPNAIGVTLALRTGGFLL